MVHRLFKGLSEGVPWAQKDHRLERAEREHRWSTERAVCESVSVSECKCVCVCVCVCVRERERERERELCVRV